MQDAFRIRVVIIDHSAFGRAALPRLIEADPSLEIAAIARNADEGLQSIQQHDPDVVVLAMHSDFEESSSLLDWIMSESPRPVVALLPADPDPDLQLQVLEAGAAFVMAWSLNTAPARLMAFQSLLAAKLKAFGVSRAEIPERARNLPSWPPSPLAQDMDDSEQYAIEDSRGSSQRSGKGVAGDRSATDNEDTQELLEESVVPLEQQTATGGASLYTASLMQGRRPNAASGDAPIEVVVLGGGAGSPSLLRAILLGLPDDLNIAILAVLRLPPDLLPRYVHRLAEDCAIPVSIAQEGDPVRPGQILLAPAGKNMGMVRTGRVPKALIRLMQPEGGMSTTPSMDITLRACAAIYGPSALGVVLGGLSRDSMAGLQAIRSKGGKTHMIDYKHAVVCNTNRLCYDSGLVDDVSGPEGVAELLSRLGSRF